MPEELMIEMYRQILEESRRFRAALPDLLQRHAGQWVVFHHGQVTSVHADADDAYREGMTRFGPDCSYVVDRVERQSAVPLTAGVVYV
ncbi:MAG: hypothetical protein ACI9OJ_002057 [Myxococcota bacterium]|jgi:hypothetical protein